MVCSDWTHADKVVKEMHKTLQQNLDIINLQSLSLSV